MEFERNQRGIALSGAHRRWHGPKRWAGRWAAALLITFEILCPQPALANPWPSLHSAAARIRIGDAIGALELLADKNADAYEAEARHVMAVLHARALVVGGLYTTAEKVLAPLLEEKELATREVVYLLALRTSSALRRIEKTRSYAKTLLKMPGLSPTVRVEATFRFAESVGWHGTLEQVQSTEKILKELLQDPSARGFRAAIFELLANTGAAAARKSRLRRLVLEYGETAEGLRATRQLPLHTLKDSQRLTRARNLYKARAYSLAEKSFQSVLSVPEMRQEALVKLGTIRTRMRDDYPAAVRLFTEAANGPDEALATEAWFRLGVSLGYLNRYDEAIETMRTCHKRDPTGPFGRDSAYQVGRLHHEAGRFRSAARAHEQFLGRKKRRDPSLWRWFLGWSHYRAGDFVKARRVFRQLKNDPNQLVGAKALYWIAKAHLHEGHRAKAKASLDALFRRAPLGYYGLLGRHLYSREFEPEGASFPLRPSGYPVQMPGRSDLKILEQKITLPTLKSAIRDARLLLACGFPAIARHRVGLHKVEERIKATSTAGDWQASKKILDTALERFRPRWTRLAPRRLAWREDLAGRRQQDVLETYPLAYFEMAQEAGRLYGVDSWWLMAHMLQESRYYANAISGAGAFGLMQVLPRTGSRIASRLGFPRGPFVATTLFDPGISIRFAAWYLDALRTEFKQSTPLAIAAYNGGPLLIGQHIRRRPDLPLDVMIEEIGPHESRNYVRKVTDHIVRYANIYLDDEKRERVLRPLLPTPKVEPALGVLRF